jgi:3-deoxy-D-manno-octulosonic-acid transferase
MKFDSAVVADRLPGDRELASSLGIAPSERIWVCGSTGPGEEEIVLAAYEELLRKHDPTLRLIIVPRKPERFDEVAQLIEKSRHQLIRRSKPGQVRPVLDNPPVILGDTMGELAKFYSLAEVVFIGRTLVNLGPKQHGSDMIEPAALAKPTIVGPFTGNFAEVMNQFRAAGAIIEIAEPSSLAKSIAELLEDPSKAKAMGQRAQQVVIQERGVTEKHIQVILGQLRKTM